MDGELAKLALIAFAIVSGLCVALGGLVLAIAFHKDPKHAARALEIAIRDGTALRIVTVFAVLGTTTVLTFAGRLTEGTLALLSGVAGYVLGGLQANGKRDKPDAADGA